MRGWHSQTFSSSTDSVALLEFIERQTGGKKDITLQNIWMEEIGSPAVETNSKKKKKYLSTWWETEKLYLLKIQLQCNYKDMVYNAG